MKLKQFIFALVAMLSSFAFTANAQEYVAKVGNTKYTTINDAITNWANGDTLTLLADVTLTRTIKLSSTEHHILDLGSYTMTAYSKKTWGTTTGYDAIEIVNNARGTIGIALDIKANETNPGRIVVKAGVGNLISPIPAIVRTEGKDGTTDRPIIAFHNGKFDSDGYVVYHSGSNGTNSPVFEFKGGVYSASSFAIADFAIPNINTDRAKIIIKGGVFNGPINMSVDSSSDAVISGGKFKKLSNSFGSTLNNDKFTIGSAEGVYDRSIYVDKDGYYVVTSEVIKEVSAKYPAVKKENYDSNNYFYYSAAATYGMFYEDASKAPAGSEIWTKPAVTISENVTGDVAVVEEIKNNTALDGYTPTNLPAGATLEIELKSVGETFVYDVTPKAADGKEVEPTGEITFRLPVPASVTEAYAKVYHEGTLMGFYAIQGKDNAKYVEISSADFSEFTVEPITPVAKIGEQGYATLAEAVAAANAGDEIVVIADVADVTVDVTKNLTISGSVTLNNVGINAAGADALTVKGLTFTGNSWINSGTAEALTVSGVTATVAPSNTGYTNSRSAFISLGRSEQQTLALTVDGCNITVTSQGPDAILGWAAITNATITNNVIKGSSDGYFWQADAIKFMAIADGAKFEIKNNEIYSNFNGIVFGQNTTRDNAYSVSIDKNKFYGDRADHIWIEISDGNTVHATVNATSANTVNGNAFTVDDIKYRSNVIKTWSSYAGVDVVTNDNGKVIGGTLTLYSNKECIAEGYEMGAGGVVAEKAAAATINGVKYATLADALAAAAAMTGDVTVEIYEKVTLNQPLTGSYSSIKFVGKDADAEIYLDVQGYIEAAGKNVAFEGLTLSKSEGGFINNAGFMNVAFGVYNVAEVTYTNCTFANGAYASAGKVTYTRCTFYRSHDKYGLWAYGNVDVTVDGCTFADYRGIKMYAENGANASVEKANLTVKNTDFSNADGKPAIVLTYGESVTLENNTYSSTGTFELDLDGAPNGVAVTSDVAPTCKNDNGACGVLVDGKIYTTVAQAAAVATNGSKVTLLHNSNETVEFVEGVSLNKNNFEAAGVTVAQPVANVATVNGVEYADLQEAINAANGGTVTLVADVTYTTVYTDNKSHWNGDLNYELSVGGNVILDLNGHTIKTTGGSSHSYYALICVRSGSLTVVDGSEAKNGAIICSAETVKERAYTIYNNGALTLNGGTVSNTVGNYAIESVTVSNTALTINDGATVTSTGIAVRVCSQGSAGTQTVVINGGNLSGTYAMWVPVKNGGSDIINMTIAGGTFTGSYNAILFNTYTNGDFKTDNIVITGGTFNGNVLIGADYDADDANHVALSAALAGKVISGGTFSNDVSDYVAEGFAIKDNGNGTFGIEEAAVVAKIGDTEYETLQAAVDAAAVGDVIVLVADVEGTVMPTADAISNPANSFVVVAAGKVVTLDLNGKTISVTGDPEAKYDAIGIRNYGDLTIVDNSEAKSGKLTYQFHGEKESGTSQIHSTILNFGTLTVNGGTLENKSTKGYAKYTINNYSWGGNANVTINGGYISNAATVAVYADGYSDFGANSCNVTVTGGTVNGGLWYNGRTATDVKNIVISGGTFIEGTNAALTIKAGVNTAVVSGGIFQGAVSIAEGIKAISGGTFSAPVNEAYCAEGFVPAQNADGTYGVVADPAYGKVAQVGATYYETLAEAVAAAQTGETVVLLKDVVLDNTVTVAKSITIDGNGHKITPANVENTYNSAFMVGDSGWGDDHGVTITINNVVFEGWSTKYGVVRAQGVTLNMDGCEFNGNSVSNASYAVLSLNFTDATVVNSKFVGNTSRAIDVNYNGDKSQAVVTVDGCTFNGNSTTGAGIVMRSAGTLALKNSTFENNTVNTNGNGATVYVGFGTGNEVSGCTFVGNTVTTSHTSTKRFASAIFCDGCVVKENVFDEGNTATRNGESITTIVAVGAYYGAADLSANYWAGKMPENGVGYTVEYTRHDVAVETYYKDAAKQTLVDMPSIMVTYPVGNPVYPEGKVEYYNDMLEAVPYTTNCPRLEGATIKLLADVEAAGLRFMENDMVLDLNGHTYTIIAGTGSQGTNTSGFQIRPEVTTNVIFKNGTIKVAEGAPVVWMFNCYATQFVVENVTVDCANMAWSSYGSSCKVVVSREGDDVQFLGTTAIENFDSDVAPNAYTIGGTMTIAETASVTGKITLSAGATLTAKEGLDVVTSEGNIVVYENGTYKVVAPVAMMGGNAYMSVEEALAAAKAAGLSDVVITIVGVNTAETKDDFGLYDETAFNNVTIKQDNGGKAYYFDCVHTGKRAVADGQFVFDGVNIVIAGQYINQCKTVLKNNSLVNRSNDTKNFIMGEMVVEAGSKFVSQIDAIYAGSLTIDGGKTDGTYNTEADYQTVFFETYFPLNIKNGAYVLINAANEIGSATLISGTTTVQASKVEVFNSIDIQANASLALDVKSIITTKNITGAGKITVKAEGVAAPVTIIKANMSGFTGTINVEGGKYEITSEGLVVKPMALDGEGTAKAPYLINNVEDLEFFRASVNAGETTYNAPGVWVALAADIDLAGTTWTEGIGDGHNWSFDGNFDGKNHTIKNLTVAPVVDANKYLCGGLFGYIYGNVTIKNLVIENATITTEAEGHNVGVLAGFANNNGGKANISGITVKGDIKVNAPNAYGVGAIVGYSYREMGTISGCTVEANDGSYIKGYSFVGGITGYSYTGATIAECSVKNIDITATNYSVAGIAGLASANNTVSNCVVENVTVNGEANVGNVIGAIAANGIVVENCTAAEPLVGGNYSDNKAVEARIGNVYYATLDAALAAEGDEVELLVPITVAAGETRVLDLNGKVVEYTSDVVGEDMITNYGNLTINSSVEGGKLTYKNTDTTGSNVTVSTISNCPGAELTINGGTIENTSAADKAFTGEIFPFAIDNLTNGTLGTAKTTVNGGVIKSNYRSIRLFANSTSDRNTVNINGGEMIGQVWLQATSAQAHKVTLVINGGKFAPAGNDASSVYVTTLNATKPTFRVLGGYFTTKIGTDNASLAANYGIAGGTFTAEAMEKTTAGLVRSGYEFVANENGEYGVETIKVVAVTDAQGNTTQYPTVDAAAKALTDGATIKLLKDVTKAFTVDGKSVTLDLNGNTLSQNGLGVFVENGGALTIVDSSDEKTGKLTATSDAVTVKNSTLVVNGGTIETTGDDDCAISMSYSTVTVNGGKLVSADNGINMIENSASAPNSLTINGGEIVAASYGIAGNGTYDHSAIVIAGGKIAGGIYHSPEGTLTISGGEITGAKALNILAGTVTVTAGKIVGETAVYYQGANTGYGEINVAISGGEFVGNVTSTAAEGLEAKTGFITGGTYSSDVTELCAAGFVAKENADGTYGVVVDPAYGKVAKIGETYYATLADAVAAAQNGETVVVIDNIALNATVVVDNKTITLDLNGKTITGTDNNTSGNFYLINNNKGNLTIVDGVGSGMITLVATTERNWSASSVVVANNLGTVTVKGGTIEHLGGTSMAYGIDNLTNGANSVATLNIEGGKVASTYFAVRQFANGGTNSLNITGGEVAYAWMQSPNSNANVANISVTGGAVAGICFSGANANVTFNADAACVGEVYGTMPAGMALVTVDGKYTFAPAVAKIGDVYYATLAEAVAAAENSATITLLQNVELASTVTVAGKAITLDLNGKTVSGTCNASQSSLVYIENNAGLTVKDSAGNGKITYAQGSSNVGWTVDVKGAFTLESGTIELTGESWSIGYAVDVRPNSWGTAYEKATVFTMNGGNIVSSDGGVRVASSSDAKHTNVSAAFVMNGGEIDAAWDGVFVQQSDAIYDVLSFTMNAGTIKSALNPVRVYGPAATGYVNGADCMNISFNGGTMRYTGTETREWVIDGILRVGGGSSMETILESGNITASEAFAQANALPEGYEWVAKGDKFVAAYVPKVAQIGNKYYATLAAAVAAAQDGDVVTLLADVNEAVTISGKTITLDLNGKKVYGEGTDAVAVSGGADVTIMNGTLETNGKNCGGVWVKDATTALENCTFIGTHAEQSCGVYASNGATVTIKNCKLTANHYGLIMMSANVTINSGEFTAPVSVSANGSNDYDDATLTINGGTFNGGIYWPANGKLTINDGTFTDETALYVKSGSLEINGGTFTGNGEAKEYSYKDSGFNATGAAVVIENVGTGEYDAISSVVITGGTFTSEKNVAIQSFAQNSNVEVVTGFISGGTYSSDVTELCAEGCASLVNLDGKKYIVGAAPTATIENLGSMVIESGYYAFDLTGGGCDNSKEMPLQFVMQYTADQTAEDVKVSPYKNWYADFVLSFSGLANGSFVADENTYLAGFYGETEAWEGIWAKIGVTGLEIENGVRYPVMSGVGMSQTYEYICAGVQEFLCAMNISPEIVAGNPDLKVTLELCLVENGDGAYSALVDGENCTVVAVKEFTADDFALPVAQVGDVKYASLAKAVAAADGKTVTVLRDVELNETLVVTGAVTIDLNGKTISQVKAQTANYSMIQNDGDLTIVDNVGGGKISYTDSGNGGEYVSNTITNRGTLTVESGIIENLSSATVARNGYPYAIDSSIWGTADEVNTIVNGGKVYCANYSAIRMRVDSDTEPVNVTVNGGEIIGTIEVQNASNKAGVGHLEITGGKLSNSGTANVLFFFGSGVENNITVAISGGEFTGNIKKNTSIGANFNSKFISGGTFSYNVTDFCAEHYFCTDSDGDGRWIVEKDPTYEPKIELVDGQFTEFTYGGVTTDTLIYKRNIGKNWEAFYVPFEVPVSQLAEQGLEVAYINGVRRDDTDYDGELDKFVMEVIYIHGGDNCDGSSKTLRADYPYFIRTKSDTVKTITITLENVTLSNAGQKKYDCTTFTEKFELVGITNRITTSYFEDGRENKYGVLNGEWRGWGANASMRPFRFYMAVTSRVNGKPIADIKSMAIAVRGEELPDGTTLIYDVEADREENDMIFDLQGRRVLETEKGRIYIKNGKKFIAQ